MKYEFKNLKTGQPCCKADSIKLLCDACLPQALAAHEAGSAAAVARVLTVGAAAPAAAATNEPPTPPSLVDAIRGSRGGAPLAPAPSFRKPATVLAQHDGVDAPPSLVDAIQHRRTR